MATLRSNIRASCRTCMLTALLAAPAAADYSVQDNVAFNARKINPYNGGPAWHFEDIVELLDQPIAPGGPVTIGPLNADPLGLVLETLFGLDLPHVVKLKVGASLSGHATVNFGYYVTAGRLDISYPASANLNFETAPGTTNFVRANQSYGVDGGFLPGVSQRTVPTEFFGANGGLGYATPPLRTQTEYQQPWFETQSPWASAWVEASANIQSSIFTKVSAFGGLKEWRKDIRAGGNVGGRLVEIDPTGLYVAGEEVLGFDLTQPIGPIPVPGPGGPANLEIRVPNIAVSSVTNGLPAQGAVISARKEQPLVKLTGNLERLIPFVGTILQNEIGPIGYDLLNLASGPELTLYQEMTFTPNPQVRLTFSEPVIVDGSPTFQAEFDLDEAINWKPMFSNSNTIQVTPTYLLHNTFKNETGLNVNLEIHVEALSLTGDFPPFNGSTPPAYDETFTIPIFQGGTLFAPEFDIPLGSVTGGSVPGIGPITTGVIEFQKSNLDLVPGLGDLELVTWAQAQPDPQNPGYFVTNLEFTRAVDGGQPRQYEATVILRASNVTPEEGGEGDEANFFESLPNVDIIAADVDTNEQVNLGRYVCYAGCDQSAFLPDSSPAYPDPNLNLGSLYVTTLPDDLTFVPNVDLNVTGHPILDQYNASDDFVVDSTVEETTEFVDRAAYPDTTILVRKGEVIPDGIGRFDSFNFGAFGMNEAGGVAHFSNLTVVPPGSGTTGFYYTDDASKNKLFRSGELVPGSSQTIVISSANSSEPNELGQVALVTGMSGSFSNSVVLRGGPDGLKTIARNGQTSPDGNGTFQSFAGRALNDLGQVAFWSRVTYPSLGTREVIYVGDGISLTEVARQGDTVPNLPGTIDSFGYNSINNSGRVVFDAYTTSNVQGLFASDNNVLTSIAVAGGAVPQGGEFVSFNDHDLNETGQVAVYSGFREFPGGPLMFGLFRGDGASMVQIAREGQLAPDQDGTLKWQSFSSFQLNDVGQVAFLGHVDAATDYRAILLGDGGNLTQIARYGMTIPDGSAQITGLSGRPQLNNQGHVAFDGTFGVDDDESAVFLYDGTNLIQVVRSGQPLAGSTVTFASLIGINDDMQVAYRAELVGGRSVIARFEPSIYWSKTVSGNWGTADNWSLGIEPFDPYDVFIVAENALTVAGPAADRTVKSLTLGADDSAPVRLHLASNVTLTATNGTTIRRNGELTGHGTLAGTVTNEGTISPGASPGVLSIDGDYTQSSTGLLHIEIASPTSYDQLVVSGDVTLSGALSVSFLDGFVPTQGQTFSIFGDQFDAITGAFESVVFPTFNGLTFDVAQSASSISLQVVPSVGDFNHDGFVNAADYIIWRKGIGVAPTQDNYNLWRAHFGQTTGSGAGATGSAGTHAQRWSASSSIPEPGRLALAAVGLIVLISIWPATTRHPRREFRTDAMM